MPREISLGIPEQLWDELRGALNTPEESAAILLAGVADTPTRLVLTVAQVHWIPAEGYLERSAEHLKLASAGWMPALKRAERLGLQPVFFHTHPGCGPEPSFADDSVDAALAQPFAVRAGTARYASMILGGTEEYPTFSGRVTAEGQTADINTLRTVGRHLGILPSVTEAASAVAARQAVHNRQILAFGSSGQQMLARLRVGVVGAGGTGSAVIEQLARLGVGHITVIDDDHLSDSNVSRVYGSSIAQEGLAKVEVAETNVERIGLGTAIRAIEGRVTERRALEALRDCDLIFGCTDDHAGRINLSKLAYWYLIPLIDLGVVIDARDGDVRSITGRITYVAPGEPCLSCRDTVDPARARDELMDMDERARLVEEGYAHGLDDPDPSVIAYTTLTAATAVAEMIERLVGFGSADVAGELILRIADRKVKGRRGVRRLGHLCDDPQQWGRGDQPSFVGQRVWPQ